MQLSTVHMDSDLPSKQDIAGAIFLAYASRQFHKEEIAGRAGSSSKDNQHAGVVSNTARDCIRAHGRVHHNAGSWEGDCLQVHSGRDAWGACSNIG